MGDKQKTLSFAVEQLHHLGHVAALSSAYLTEPWGYISENLFLNQVATLETELMPHELLGKLQLIEQKSGRIHPSLLQYNDRSLDIDLLGYDEIIILDTTLTIPHPKLHLRKFVLVPFAEIAPDWVHPILHQTVQQLLARCPDTTSVVRQNQ